MEQLPHIQLTEEQVQSLFKEELKKMTSKGGYKRWEGKSDDERKKYMKWLSKRGVEARRRKRLDKLNQASTIDIEADEY
jgi:hypothetical protein